MFEYLASLELELIYCRYIQMFVIYAPTGSVISAIN